MGPPGGHCAATCNALAGASATALQHCEELIQQYNRAENSIWVATSKPLPPQNVTSHVGKAVEDCMRAVTGVLLNLTNDKERHEEEEEDDEELDLSKALQHPGKHMEDCMVASYTALLLNCLCQESPINVSTVRAYLPEGDFSIMTGTLKKFLSFMNLTCAVGTTGQKSISRVIEYLEQC
ncbi:Wings apart-like protein-like protein [Heterocephalus glaber]|uniref:Wings apart-like protein-like protein n=1 Tax=Heterocephalus glaber TaxID=10181 RepID=G5B8J2_HETGA|nr:Wings apart-like protein-like protein [Heterocephalus glaber]